MYVHSSTRSKLILEQTAFPHSTATERGMPLRLSQLSFWWAKSHEMLYTSGQITSYVSTAIELKICVFVNISYLAFYTNNECMHITYYNLYALMRTYYQFKFGGWQWLE